MYNHHNAIPKDKLKELKAFFNINNIEEVDIEDINDYFNTTTFEVVSIDRDETYTNTFDNIKDALVECDRLTNYNEGSDIAIILYQDGEVVKYYHQRQWKFPKKSIYQ